MGDFIGDCKNHSTTCTETYLIYNINFADKKNKINDSNFLSFYFLLFQFPLILFTLTPHPPFFASSFGPLRRLLTQPRRRIPLEQKLSAKTLIRIRVHRHVPFISLKPCSSACDSCNRNTCNLFRKFHGWD